MTTFTFHLRRCRKCRRSKPKVHFPLVFHPGRQRHVRRKTCDACISKAKGPTRIIGNTPVAHDDNLAAMRVRRLINIKTNACKGRERQYESTLDAYLDAPSGSPQARAALDRLKGAPRT